MAPPPPFSALPLGQTSSVAADVQLDSTPFDVAETPRTGQVNASFAELQTELTAFMAKHLAKLNAVKEETIKQQKANRYKATAAATEGSEEARGKL